ncbi:MAG TPA: DUF5131 family protein, partial [Verrucomicrobiae bacterium]|nr:DUF5131 family protein [Verrucomicrobiae bacterium]
MENSNIAWTDHTWNFVWGCVEVSPACANCYARIFSQRLGLDIWGKNKPRRIFGEAHFQEPLKWNNAASIAMTESNAMDLHGHRPRVFCSSMADIGEDYEGCTAEELERQRAILKAKKSPILIGGKAEFDEARRRTWEVIEQTP